MVSSSLSSSKTSPPKVTVFTSIAGIAQQLRDINNHQKALAFELVEVTDDALSGFGGTIHFEPSRLSAQNLEKLRRAEILITEPAVLAPLLSLPNNDVNNDDSVLPNLKWVQSTYAGVDPLLTLDCHKFSFTLTRFAGKFGPPMAEWCLARIIAHERNFSAAAADQAEHVWCGRKHELTSYRYLSDLTLVILGCGDIGCCIARAAKAFGMRVIGFVRTARQQHSIEVDAFVTNLGDAIRQADYIVSVLPSTKETVGLLSGDALSPCKDKSPVFINVGRGSVIDEASLLSALDRGFISAAILDVFETEPLLEASRLWDRQDVTISPHVSGLTRGADIPGIFVQNFERYCQGEQLLYSVDWNKGY